MLAEMCRRETAPNMDLSLTLYTGTGAARAAGAAAPLARGAPGVLLDLADAQAPLRLADEDALDQVLALRRDARVLGELVVDAHDAVQHLGARAPVMRASSKLRQESVGNMKSAARLHAP